MTKRTAPGDFGPRGSPFVSRPGPWTRKYGHPPLTGKDYLKRLALTSPEPAKTRALPLREGVWQRGEEEADELLRLAKAIEGFRDSGTWHDLLMPDQMHLREWREISMDPATFNKGLTPGLYRRAWADWDKRPHKWWNQLEDPAWDARVGLRGNQTGYSDDLLPSVDPEWPPAPPTHLDRYQRSRIRRTLRAVPPGHARLRSLTRWVLAAKYGIRISDILRLE